LPVVAALYADVGTLFLKKLELSDSFVFTPAYENVGVTFK
jgi:hypothetical protein